MTLVRMGRGMWVLAWPYMVAAAVLVAGAVLWRLTRRRIRRALRRRMSVSARRTLRRFRARIDRFKLMRHADVRQALLNDTTLLRSVAVAAAELVVVFGFIVLFTGPLWARKAWGIWWDWQDVRLTTTLIMWMT